MTIDDESSIYVGGLPYNCTQESLREHFELFGAVVALKIINDHDVGGKCYGFVTFRNPKSAADAIIEMNGKTIEGRTIKVGEVRTRGGRPNFDRDNFRRDIGREADWGRGRGRGRDHYRDRDHYWDRNNDRSQDRDKEREREYDQVRDRDRRRENSLDHDREERDEDKARIHARDWEKGDHMDWDQETNTRKDADRRKDIEKDHQSRTLRNNRFGDRRDRELSSNSSDEYIDGVKGQLDMYHQRLEDLQSDISELQDKVEYKTQHVSDLQKKSQKLEEALAAARKLSFQQKTRLTKLQRSFHLVQDCTENLKNSEHELQSLVDDAKIEVGTIDDGMDASL